MNRSFAVLVRFTCTCTVAVKLSHLSSLDPKRSVRKIPGPGFPCTHIWLIFHKRPRRFEPLDSCNLFVRFCSFVLLMAAPCKNYLAWNVENFLLNVSFSHRFLILLFIALPPLLPFLIGFKFIHATLLWILVRAETRRRRWSISFLQLLSIGGLPKGIIKSTEGASLTIC